MFLFTYFYITLFNRLNNLKILVLIFTIYIFVLYNIFKIKDVYYETFIKNYSE